MSATDDAQSLPTVIGCGNLLRSDDGVGCQVVRQLQQTLPAAARQRMRLLDAGTDGIAVLYAARGARSLTLIDACRGLGRAGDIFEVPATAIDNAPPDGLNPHALRWDHAIHAARQILRDQFPDDALVYLIEAAQLAPGLALSAPVAAAAQDVARRIRVRLEAAA